LQKNHNRKILLKSKIRPNEEHMTDAPVEPTIETTKKKVNLLKPTGTNDFLPEDMDKRRWLTRIIEDHFLTYGYQQIMIPTYDFFELYRIRSGEKIINDIFTFMDPPSHRSETDAPIFALRPEFTAPLVRFYNSSELMYRQAAKILLCGDLFPLRCSAARTVSGIYPSGGRTLRGR
jgi:hypothetical protein